MSSQKSPPWLPLLIGIPALLPGLVTWMFANNEAESFSSDWVVICTPLLLIAALSGVAFGKRMLGTPGIDGATLLSLVGLGGLFFVLSTSIDEKIAWHTQRDALNATQSFCEGAPSPHPEAPVFSVGARASIQVFSQTVARDLSHAYSPELSAWTPQWPRIVDTTLVACVIEVETSLEVCQYQGGHQLTRVRRDRQVQLYSLHTGQLVAETILSGTAPGPCEHIEEFRGEGENRKAGATPGDEVVATFLRSYAAPTRP